MERPLGVARDWSAAGVEKQRTDLTAFEERARRQEDPSARVAQQVDHRLIGSALARVRWELDIYRQSTNKIVGISDEAAAFLGGFF